MSKIVDLKDSSIIYDTIEKATNTANEAEDASFAGLLQEAIKKYLAAANQYLEVLKYTRDEETIKGMSFLAEIQRAKAKELMQKIEEVHPVYIQRSNYYGNVNSPETPSSLHSNSKPNLLPKVSNSPRDFSWQRFWQHVEELLEILPKPIFDDPSLNLQYNDGDNNNNNTVDKNNEKYSDIVNLDLNTNNNNKISKGASGNTLTPTRLNVTFPPLQKIPSEEDFFEIKTENETPKRGNLFFPIQPIENYDPHSQTPNLPSSPLQNTLSKDERIRILEEENKMLKLSIVRFRQELQVKAKKLHIFEPTNDDLKSHEIECGIGMYIGKQLQKIGQLELDVSNMRTLLAEMTQKYQEQLQRNEKLEKRWSDLKKMARSKDEK